MGQAYCKAAPWLVPYRESYVVQVLLNCVACGAKPKSLFRPDETTFLRTFSSRRPTLSRDLKAVKRAFLLALNKSYGTMSRESCVNGGGSDRWIIIGGMPYGLLEDVIRHSGE